MKGGNFGQYDTRDAALKKGGMMKHGVWKLKRVMRLVRSYPEEALWEPVFRVWHLGWRKIVDYWLLITDYWLSSHGKYGWHGGPQADFGERKLSGINRELMEMGPQADGGGERQLENNKYPQMSQMDTD